jgi:hypothetical protein
MFDNIFFNLNSSTSERFREISEDVHCEGATKKGQVTRVNNGFIREGDC